MNKYSNFRLRIENRVFNSQAQDRNLPRRARERTLALVACGRADAGTGRQVVPVEQAVEFFTQYIRDNPGDGYGYAMRRSDMAKQRKELELAKKRKITTRRYGGIPWHAVAYSNRGCVWDEKKEYDKAIADYDAAIRIDPSLAATHFARGNSWTNKKEYDRAIDDYDVAISIDPNYATAYCGRGFAWLRKKNIDTAIVDYNIAIRLDPAKRVRLLRPGRCLALQRGIQQVITDHDEAIRIDPKHVDAYSGRGLA